MPRLPILLLEVLSLCGMFAAAWLALVLFT